MTTVAEARIQFEQSSGARTRRAYAAELVEHYVVSGDLMNARHAMGWLLTLTRGARLRSRVGIMKKRVRFHAADSNRALRDLDQLLTEFGIYS